MVCTLFKEKLYENENLEKNKHAAEILVTCDLPIEIICSPPKSHETFPLKAT